jgi:hypothetical protein
MIALGFAVGLMTELPAVDLVKSNSAQDQAMEAVEGNYQTL